MAAEYATPEKIAFFVRHTSGVICAPITGERARRARPAARWSSRTPRASAPRSPSRSTTATARRTGISAADRAATIQALVDPATRPGDLARPGHIFPLRYPRGRRAQAGRPHRGRRRPGPHGRPVPGRRAVRDRQRRRTMARVPDLERFCAEHGLLMISIADLIRYRRQTEKLVRRVAEARIPTEWGDFTCYVVRVGARRRAARRVRAGRRAGRGRRARPGAQRVPHRRRVRLAALRLRRRSSTPRCRRSPRRASACVVYLRGHEGRGIGIGHKIRAYSLQDAGPRHRRRQPRARPAGRQPRVRHRRADPRRPRHHDACG